jgi:hypothetical protein
MTVSKLLDYNDDEFRGVHSTLMVVAHVLEVNKYVMCGWGRASCLLKWEVSWDTEASHVLISVWRGKVERGGGQLVPLPVRVVPGADEPIGGDGGGEDQDQGSGGDK